MVGEGGNLGMTQLGRVEFGLHGGATNTDFIDNAGGVDCSDHEVYIKILLNEVVQGGDMTEKQRNQLLGSMTDEVAGLPLPNLLAAGGAARGVSGNDVSGYLSGNGLLSAVAGGHIAAATAAALLGRELGQGLSEAPFTVNRP